MSEVKLFLAVNSSEAFLALRRDETLKQWGFSDYRTVSRLGQAGAQDLFGNTKPSVMMITDKADMEKLVEDLESGRGLDQKLDAGLIILTNMLAASTKKIQTLVTKLDGTVHATNKKDQAKLGPEMVNELNLKPEVKRYLIEWAGDDAANLISIVRAVGDLPASKQKLLSIDDVMIRLPLPPGAIPPWDVEKPLWKKDLNETIKIYRRISATSAPILVSTVLSRKLQLIYKVAFFMENSDGMSEAEIGKAAGVVGNQMWALKPIAKQYGSEKLEKIVLIMRDLDEQLKSGITVADARFELALAKIIMILKS